MHQNKLFNRTRIQLAGWYTGVMGIILGLAGLTTYQMLSHAHWQAVEQELASISGTLHDNLESKLRQPGEIEPSVEQTLPGLCLANNNCSIQANQPGRHILGIVQQGSFYLRFFDLSGRMIAMLGLQPQGLSDDGTAAGWQTLQDRQGTRYHQVSLRLKTTAGTPWGYMQVGRSLKEYDDHLRFLRLLIGLGLPTAMLLVAIASWWLAGRAMQPVYFSYQQMQQFTADAAHELRTPIAAIRATIESTHDNNSFSIQDAHETLAVVERQNSRLAQLVQEGVIKSEREIVKMG
jgi:signal transduction histidine kinase